MNCTTKDGKIYYLDKLCSLEYCEQMMKDCVKIGVCSLSHISYELKTLPKYLEILAYEGQMYIPFNYTLPKKLIYISYGLPRIDYFQLSSRLKEVLPSDDYNYYVKTPKTVEKYRHGIYSCCPYKPSKRLTWFAIGHKYNTVIDLPKNLKKFILSASYDQKIILPLHIKHICFVPNPFKKQNRLLLTEHLQTIKNYKHNHFLRDNLPECLIEFEAGVRVKIEHGYENIIDFNEMNKID